MISFLIVTTLTLALFGIPGCILRLVPKKRPAPQVYVLHPALDKERAQAAAQQKAAQLLAKTTVGAVTDWERYERELDVRP